MDGPWSRSDVPPEFHCGPDFSKRVGSTLPLLSAWLLLLTPELLTPAFSWPRLTNTPSQWIDEGSSRTESPETFATFQMPPKMKNRICLPIILASCALACLTNSSSAEDKKVYNLATVVKISGINWFNYMETGVKKFGTGHRQ